MADGRNRPPATKVFLLTSRQEDREEHNTFRKGSAQDRLNQDLGGRAGIPPDGFRGFHTDDTHADGGAQAGGRDVNITGHLC
jgi:hypothetical protein